jgi:Bacterial regulatory proteins, tetR family
VAERLFRQIGYQKTTVGDIAKELRMSLANVYRFFESKKAISPGGGAGPGEQDGCLLEPPNASVNAKSNDEKKSCGRRGENTPGIRCARKRPVSVSQSGLELALPRLRETSAFLPLLGVSGYEAANRLMSTRPR